LEVLYIAFHTVRVQECNRYEHIFTQSKVSQFNLATEFIKHSKNLSERPNKVNKILMCEAMNSSPPRLMAQQPLVDQRPLIVDALRLHSDTPH
jgi:hypothetical protein